MSRELGTVSQGPYDVAHHPTTKRSFAQPGSLATSADFGDAAAMSEKAVASRYPVLRHRGSRDTHGPFTSHHCHTARPCCTPLRPPPTRPAPPLSAPFDAQGNAAAITGLESVWATDGHKSVRTESSATTAISRSAGGRKDLRRDLFWIQCSLKKHGLAA